MMVLYSGLMGLMGATCRSPMLAQGSFMAAISPARVAQVCMNSAEEEAKRRFLAKSGTPSWGPGGSSSSSPPPSSAGYQAPGGFQSTSSTQRFRLVLTDGVSGSES